MMEPERQIGALKIIQTRLGLVRDIGDRQGWEIHRRREFQNDALIALTARRFGATIVTTNLPDFELLRAALRISVLTVA